MSDKTTVLLITGFLGSGKTTLLNRLVRAAPDDLKLTILMNEFGEIGIDGTLVEGEDLDMLEISRGSIFCVCVKTDFIRGLYELNTKIKPDLLIIESTGVANPTDLKRDLKLSIFNERFQFSDQFCLIDAANFLEAFEVFASVEKQIETSTVFIINKVDLVDESIIQQIKHLIRQHHPAPRFFETSFAEIPLTEIPALEAALPQLENGSYQSACLTNKDLETFITTVLESPDSESTPPDELASVTYLWRGTSRRDLEPAAQLLPEGIVRAKGFVDVGGTIFIFSYVMGDWTLESTRKSEREIKNRNMIVFIGSSSAIQDLGSILTPPHWSAREILQPFGQISTIE